MDQTVKAQMSFGAILFCPIVAWIVVAKSVFGFTPQNVRERFVYYITHTFSLWPLWSALLGGLIVGILIAVAIHIYGKQTFAGAYFSKFYRGTQLVTSAALARLTKESVEQITIAGVPIPTKVESTHISVGGATGTGKSTIFKEMMYGCLKRGDRMVILDPDGEFLSTFYREGKDVILNPYDQRSAGWNFFNEIRDEYDFKRYANSIVQKSDSSDSEEWNEYGRLLFTEVAKKVHATKRNPTMADVFKWTNQCSSEELEEFVKGTKANALFTGNEKASSSVRFVLSNKLAPHLDMPNGDFSFRRWLEDPQGGNLYITWDENMRAALRPLISCFVDTIFSSMLGMPTDLKRRLWVYLDELESLENLATLGAALTRGRKKGLRVVSGYQTYTQLVKVYGEEQAETMLSNHRSMVAMAVGRMGEKTAEKMSKALGQHEVMRTKEGRSARFGGMATSSKNDEVKPEAVVMASEIMTLQDLEGFMAFPGKLPVARFQSEVVNYNRARRIPGIVPLRGELEGYE
ncbi:conjugal transfer protein TraJ [Pseudomonas syringae pv. actinidiae]|jgi:type IV secretory pathway TraG/TraD family ATPase VirD4|uniref:IncW plasmid conjugative protein TrwB (TraD-like protein) n=1 Tax=Pseudomonas syringae pv. actinidiae TaxID=103796 RepID=A0A2P0QFW0_PSESF|nr:MULTISPECIES: type IV secretion system DNA-binding domain-containing protein [Pseudomonas syringae group]ARO45281.1 IncW plasmid conjugative protein TrwB (TraD-like protein) [Pseudomonas syringae pv. actinidiae]OKS70538.1 conjugal transfer protein TraJ [Pseudomonas syringae pv. actinidiae]RMQ64956.1 IncW plasmid conjugative protein TrwB [Pseudomonas savastanoi pv. glycinea]